jgi:hypothetical protein
LANQKKTFYILNVPDTQYALNYTTQDDVTGVFDQYGAKVKTVSVVADLHAIAARDKIEELEKEAQSEERDKQIVKLSIDYSVLSNLTSFIAVELREDVGGEMELKDMNKNPFIFSQETENGSGGLLWGAYDPCGAGANYSQLTLECATGPLDSDEFCDMEECDIDELESEPKSLENVSTNLMDCGSAVLSMGSLPSSKVTTEEPAGPLKLIIDSQEFEGNWVYSFQLDLTLSMKKGLVIMFGEEKIASVYVTVWICAYLCSKEAQSRAIWKLIYEKSAAFLESLVGNSDEYGFDLQKAVAMIRDGSISLDTKFN